jgi:Uma2 family endonuclease
MSIDVAPRNQPPAPDIVFYPSEDGEPMAETEVHYLVITDIFQALRALFNGAKVHLCSDQFFYYEEGNPSANKSPDIMVIKGKAFDILLRSYKLWEERIVPQVIFESASESTWEADLTTKKDVFERLGVQEYFLVDPCTEYLDRQIVGFRLENGAYVRIPEEPDGSLISKELYAKLLPHGVWIRVIDLRTGKAIPHLHEVHKKLEQAETRADEEAFRAQVMEQRATREAEQKAKEAERATHEAARAAAAETENARLRALIEELQKTMPQS